MTAIIQIRFEPHELCNVNVYRHHFEMCISNVLFKLYGKAQKASVTYNSHRIYMDIPMDVYELTLSTKLKDYSEVI